MDKKEEQRQVKIFVVKTTTGQERNVARLIASKVEMNHIPIKALLVPDTLKGYVFVEADGPHLVEEAITGLRHVRSRIPGLVSFAEIERYIVENQSWKTLTKKMSSKSLVDHSKVCVLKSQDLTRQKAKLPSNCLRQHSLCQSQYIQTM